MAQKSSFKTQNSGYMISKVPSKHKIPVTVVQTVLSKRKILVTQKAQKLFQNTKFWLQYHKNSFKHKILVTVAQKSSFKTQNSGYTISKVLSKHKIPVTISQKFFQTQNSGYNITKILSNTKFLLQYHKNSFKHKILVTISQKFFENTKFQFQYHKNSSTKLNMSGSLGCVVKSKIEQILIYPKNYTKSHYIHKKCSLLNMET